MIKIMMHGCNGKMGRMITEIVKKMCIRDRSGYRLFFVQQKQEE